MRSLAKTAASIAGLLLLFALLANALFVIRSLRSGELYDFGSFMASGQEARAGHNPYSTDNKLVFEISFDNMGLSSKLPNANPPLSVLFFEHLATQSPLQALNLWRIISAALYAGAILVLLLNYRSPAPFLRILWAVCLAGFWHTLQLGQIYTVLLLLIALTWIFLEKQWRTAAALLMGVLVAIKPNLVVWPLFLGLAGYWSILWTSATAAGLLSLIPAIIYGPQIYLEWFAVSNQFGALAFPGNNSLVGLLVRFGSPEAGYALSLALLAYLIYWLRRGRHSLARISSVGIIASLLLAPLAWTGYTIFLLPYFLTKKVWGNSDLFCAAILATPFLFVLSAFQYNRISFVAFGWFYGWALIILLGRLLWFEEAEPGDQAGARAADPRTNVVS